jgi:amino acid adenylation domain-containing protein
LVSFSGIENSAGVEDSLVHELVDLQAQLNPDAIALICGKQSLSYQELNVRSNQLAQYLRASGMRLGIPVVVSIERGITSIVLLLAILKNGGIWIPLEVDCPIQRLRTILDDVGRCFVVVDRKTNTRIAQLDSKNCTILNIDDLTDAANHMSLEKLLSIDIPPNSPAYMIYTSGTTGQPKGVLISHQSISTHCRAVIACYDLSNADVVLQFAAHHVDTSLEQIFASLTCGASLLIREGDLWSPNEFSAILDAHLISVADLPPAYLREVLQAWKNDPKRAPRHFPRLLIVGGEILSPSIIDLLRSGPFVGTRLLNAYGPTEATITSSIHEVDLQKFDTSIPIGKPLPGGFIVILDRDGNLVPEGVIGELHIGGVRLANSYHRRSSLNHDRFIPCPVELIKFNDTSDSLLYRTGDLASHVKGGNGTISFHGRVDHQIKIRGFRVELSEIEAVLREFGMLEAAVFSTLSENGEQILHACIVPGTEKFDREELDIFMSERLPTIMCPASYVVCDTLPLTNSGKLDRDFILSKTSEVQKLKNEIYQPSDETEIRLAKLWFEILGKEVLDVHSDFFVEGGNSLMAIRLLAAISSEFDQTLETSALLRASTFLAQAQLLRQGQVSNYDLDSPLVLLAEGEPNMVPLFLIHPVGGDVLCYVPLARALGGKRSIYGLRYIELNESSRFINIEHIAESYVALIRQVQPSGPYQLGGWSLGGVIAYEIAQQLNAAGQQVQMLALIDSYTPSLIEKLELEFKDNVSKQILINPNKHFYLEHPRSKYEVTLSDHLRRYHPKPYHGQVTLFYASDHQPQDLTLGWGELIRSGLTMHALPGHHYSMLEASHLDVLVALLSTDLLTVDFSIDKWK